MGSLKPYSGPFGKPELLHLLRRTLFGTSKSDLSHFQGQNLNQVIDQLVPATPALPDPPVRAYYNNVDPSLDTIEKNKDTGEITVPWGSSWVAVPIQANYVTNPSGSRGNSLKQWWTGLQVHQDRTAYEKMVLFLQNIIVTEYSVVGNPNTMYNTQNLYRKYALGNYKQLIKDITLDPGMLRYLNGFLNSKTAPDENYARELQELFCVGKGPGSFYTEDDVKAAARILTGWSFATQEKIGDKNYNIVPRTVFSANKHDTSDKQFSSFYGNRIIQSDTTITDPNRETESRKRAEKEIDDLIEMIFDTEEVSRYLCRRLWNYFVYYDITPEIEAEVIEPLAELFRQHKNSQDQLQILLKALLSSDFFFKSEHRGCMIKSPSDFVVGMFRQFEYPLPGPITAEELKQNPIATKLETQYYLWNIIRNNVLNSGQDINDPPNVAGWPAYYQSPNFHEMWVDTVTYPYRKSTYETTSRNKYSFNKADKLFGGTSSGSFDKDNKNPVFLNFVDFVKKFENPSDPNALIDEAVELLLGAPLSKSVKDQLKTNYLLLGQSTDYYWTDAYEVYIANPNTTDPESRRVPTMLQDLFMYLMSSAEYHLC